MSSEQTNIQPPTSSARFSIDAFNVNLIALLLAIALVIIGVKLTSFLPSKYYFSFSKLVDSSSSTTPFLIGTPAYVSEDDVCKALDRDPSLKKITCKSAANAEEQAGEDEAYKKEERIANRAVRQEAQAQDSLGNIAGFAIRLLVPALVGFLIIRTFGPAAELAACAGSAGGAIILCWPVIVLWKLVVTESFQDMYGQFMLLYVLGAVSFFYMARIGATFARILADAKILTVSIWSILRRSSSKIIESSLIAILTAVGSKFPESVILKS